MPVGSVVLTPGTSIAVPGVPTLDLSGHEIDPDVWTARVAVEIGSSTAAAPLLLVFTGEACAQAPRLGFAQRSARRPVAGYVLIDPVLPKPGSASDWPDAPVTVVITDGADDDTRSAALGARLRGWEVIEGDAAAAVQDISARP